MQQSKRHFLRVPRHLISDRSVLSSDIRVFAVLMDLSSTSRDIESGLDELAKQTGLTKRTVCDSLARLEERGFISRDSRRGPRVGLIQLNGADR